MVYDPKLSRETVTFDRRTSAQFNSIMSFNQLGSLASNNSNRTLTNDLFFEENMPDEQSHNEEKVVFIRDLQGDEKETTENKGKEQPKYDESLVSR